MTLLEIKDTLRNQALPNYSKGEERFNWISHAIGLVFGFVVLGYIIVLLTTSDYNIWQSLSLILYACTTIFLYANSTIYHALPKESTWKNLFRLIDHNIIYLLIAGTYAPICAFAFEGTYYGILIFSLEIIGLLVGTIMNLANFNGKVTKIITVILYVVMGWLVVFFYPAMQLVAPTAFLLILFGGISYTLGVVFYALGKKKKWMHSVFHIFVLIGTILHFIGILLLII